MIRARLLTSDGQFVHEIELPPFRALPNVIVWGERFFVLCDDGDYREGFVWFHVER